MLIVARATDIEAISNCPYRKKHEVRWDNKYFEVWHIIHLAHQSQKLAIMNLWYNDKLEYKDKDIIKKIIEKQIPKYHKSHPLQNDSYEITLTARREYNLWDGELILKVEWHSDRVWYNNWIWEIHDYKTAKSPRDEDMKKSAKQSLIYSYMFMKQFNLQEINFKYIVYIKTWLPYYEVYEYHYTLDEIKEIVESMFDDYVNIAYTWEYEAKENKWCVACDIKKCWKCPLFKTERYD